MELTQLKYFLEVARTEHVTQSAKNLFIVQPALTQSIHKLEDELGVLLFKNQGRNIRLTENGRFFYERLRPIYEELTALPQILRDSANKRNNDVKLNVLAASTLITQAIIEYQRENHDLNVDLIQNEETKIFDICVRTYATFKPELDNSASDETFVTSERIFLAVPNTAQYKKQNCISLFDVKEKFIGLYGSKQYRKICNELCESIGFKTNVTFESDNVLAVKEAIAAGIGVGFWPEISWGRMDHKKIRLLEITDANFKRDIVISLRRNKQDNTNTEAFYRFLTHYVKCRRRKPGKS
jgi:LysR family transcriptional regulator, transcription activator of glutamate synthase operon